MKRQYTDEHASAGVDAELPEIETWPNQFRTTRSRFRCRSLPRCVLKQACRITAHHSPLRARQACLELKSLKMYMLAYRNLGIFQENVVNRFLRDIVRRPNRSRRRWLESSRHAAEFTARLRQRGAGKVDAKLKG